MQERKEYPLVLHFLSHLYQWVFLVASFKNVLLCIKLCVPSVVVIHCRDLLRHPEVIQIISEPSWCYS